MSEEPIWETNCETSSLTVSEFFENFNKSFEIDNTWLYFDYKHLSTWFSEVFKDINWSCVGFPERGAEDSTLWIGTEGAHTPCHFDSYGCNIVAQLYGKKVWLLFDPLESNSLSPTRVPYEESSVYSDINFACTCHPFPDIKNARCVILQPGDILYVPKHWWHYVENVTSAISVNTWIPVESDTESRVDESLVKFFVSSVVKELDGTDVNKILNPNERDLIDFKINQNIDELSWCVEKVKKLKLENKNEVINIEYLKDFTIPTDSLHNIVKNLRKCKNPKEFKVPDTKTVTVKDLINAFCHPDVIINVKKNLYKKVE
uniref:JmjC domain-containing protein n=1 Tax=Rhodnius prolixus TaxID=13249 RepID=T1HMH0_RHOPR